MIADDDIGDGGNRQIGHQQKRIIQILPSFSTSGFVNPARRRLGIPLVFLGICRVFWYSRSVRAGCASHWRAYGEQEVIVSCIFTQEGGISHFWSFSGVTLLGTVAEAWKLGGRGMMSSHRPLFFFLQQEAPGVGWILLVGGLADATGTSSRSHGSLKSWMMQTGDSILTSCSVLASSWDLASLSPYLSPPACLILSLFLSRPVSGRTS